MQNKYMIKNLFIAILGFIFICLLFLDKYDTKYLKIIILVIFYIFAISEFIKEENKMEVRTNSSA